MHKGDRFEKIRSIAEGILIIFFCFAIVYLSLNFYLDKKSKKSLMDMRNAVKASRLQLENLSIPEEAIKRNEEKKENKKKEEHEIENNNQAGETKKAVLDIYKEFYDKNEYFTGWLYVEETDLEFPIMKGPDNKFYLSHDIDRRYDKFGMLIMDDNCDYDLENPQLIIYGHNVNSNKSFGELLFYRDKAYCDYHPSISFDTLYEKGSYTIFAVFSTTVEEAQKENSLFTTWNFEGKEEFDSFIKWAKEKSIYERDYTPKFGDELLTLVTCEHTKDEGRFVVMAAKVK